LQSPLQPGPFGSGMAADELNKSGDEIPARVIMPEMVGEQPEGLLQCNIAALPLQAEYRLFQGRAATGGDVSAAPVYRVDMGVQLDQPRRGKGMAAQAEAGKRDEAHGRQITGHVRDPVPRRYQYPEPPGEQRAQALLAGPEVVDPLLQRPGSRELAFLLACGSMIAVSEAMLNNRQSRGTVQPAGEGLGCQPGYDGKGEGCPGAVLQAQQPFKGRRDIGG